MTSSRAAPCPEIATLRIELKDSDPLVWREVEIPTSITVDLLHAIVQAAMGWQDEHLWELVIARQLYGPQSDEWGMNQAVDASTVRLRDVLAPRRTRIDYMYDFGDSWCHQLVVDKKRKGQVGLAYPRLVGGERACPPEDCGGIWGYSAILEDKAEPLEADDEDFEGPYEDYDPDALDLDKIHARLAHIAAFAAALPDPV
jgi:hypothetical protein